MDKRRTLMEQANFPKNLWGLLSRDGSTIDQLTSSKKSKFEESN